MKFFILILILYVSACEAAPGGRRDQPIKKYVFTCPMITSPETPTVQIRATVIVDTITLTHNEDVYPSADGTVITNFAVSPSAKYPSQCIFKRIQ